MPQESDGGGSTILLVEDEAIVRDVITEALATAGYEVIAVRNGYEAIERIDGLSSVGLLITDVAMPGLSGADLATRLRTSRPQLKTLFISGYAIGDLGREAGIPYLQKPFMPDELISKVSEILHGPS